MLATWPDIQYRADTKAAFEPELIPAVLDVIKYTPGDDLDYWGAGWIFTVSKCDNDDVSNSCHQALFRKYHIDGDFLMHVYNPYDEQEIWMNRVIPKILSDMRRA